ncbi:alpha-amylase family protein [Rhizohabitans arisaemae]|uniref:alpha-amylase family protein n=1 Tax=Rhizohabitans arisaemae TaxID=2720610 RepID=UPI0024B1F28E|nr:alpha-amylase family protein [Rhizohabitans arisaemae]
MLVDLEIPAWDERFLSKLDPAHMADLYVRAGAEAVMLPCKNLSGWLFWPMPGGTIHPRIGDRDIVGETTSAARKAGLEVCAYFAALYDNKPFHDHPEWRFVPAQGWGRTETVADRHGHCCPNSADYRDYVAAQIDDLFTRYSFDCAFVDMTFWPGVCVCANCRRRLKETDGLEIPERVDWTDSGWTTFQRRREEWIVEFQTFISERIKQATPGIAVYHNFAPAPHDWRTALPFDTTDAQDFLGADLYGDETEQLLVMKLMRTLSRRQPAEYMTFAPQSFAEHVELKSDEELREHVLSAAAEGVASLFIEALDPLGTVNDDAFEHVGRAFDARKGLDDHEPDLPVEEVALYFSSDSKFGFASQGTFLRDIASADRTYPHLASLRGAAHALQRSQIQFGVVTHRQLDSLDRYKVVVLPNVHRMSAREVDAFRAFVAGGGRLYASGYTSLLESDGTLHDDFMLADVFGASLVEEVPARVAYLRPSTDELVGCCRPQRYLSHRPGDQTLAGGLMRIQATAEAEELAHLTLPYASPAPGHFSAEDWASIHSFPPWHDTGEPALVRHRYGRGLAVYSALPIETGLSEAAGRVFTSLVSDLLGDDRELVVRADPTVRASAFRSPDGRRLRIVLLNHPRRVLDPVTISFAATSTSVVEVVDGRTGLKVPVRRVGDRGEILVEEPFEYLELRATLGDDGRTA